MCKSCAGIGGHLTSCVYYKKGGKYKNIPLKATPHVNYTLVSQSKKLLWQLGTIFQRIISDQVDNQAVRLLRYRIVFNDGGEVSKKHKAANILTPNSSVYCSSGGSPTVNMGNPIYLFIPLRYTHHSVLEFEGPGIPWVTHVIMKAPRMKFDSPVKSAAVFVSGKEFLYLCDSLSLST